MKKGTITEAITILNIIIFLYSGVGKIMDFDIFREQLAISPITESVAKPIALLLPLSEFAIVLMLIVPRWRLKGLYVIITLMTIFTAYIIALFSISTEMPCSCGGLIELLSWKQHLLFNTALMLLDIWAIILLRKEKKELLKAWVKENMLKISNG
jgi:uncharacterized membrane protein YphA (DoxX/SURF4 family)